MLLMLLILIILMQKVSFGMKKIEKALLWWEKAVTETFVENYLELVTREAPDIVPEGKNFDKALAIF